MNTGVRMAGSVLAGTLAVVVFAAVLALVLVASARTGDLIVTVLLVFAVAVGAGILFSKMRPLIDEPDPDDEP